MDRREQYDRLNRDRLNRDRHKTLRIVLLKVLLPLVIVGSSVAVLIVLHLDGTLRVFLDRQSMFGMIAVVLVLNIVGFAFIYMLSMVWKSVKHDLLHYRDP
jgi:hypothetical protein